jgi:peptidoglycan DL-endopeptidase CwlO
MSFSVPLRRIALACVVVTSLSGGLAATASADNETSVPVPSEVPQAPNDKMSNKKEKCLRGVDKRVADLAAWTVKLDSLTNVSAATKTTLKAELATVSTGLTTVARPAVVAATTSEAIKAACQAVVNQYRVYAVVHPKVFSTAGIDATLASAAAMRAKLNDVTKGAGNADVTALIDKAVATANAAQTSLAPITPATYNAAPDATKATLKSVRDQLKSARHDLKDASRKIKELAKSAKRGKKPKKSDDDDDDRSASTTSSTSSTTSPSTTSTSTTSTSTSTVASTTSTSTTTV